MPQQRIAIIGLGRVGGEFLKRMLPLQANGLEIHRCAQNSETEGKALAREQGIPLGTLYDVLAEGESIDIIFDLTGNPEVRQELREKLAAAGNRHTVVAPESIAQFVWLVMGEELPEVHSHSGY
jgi:predicted dehydrogenase